MTPASDPAATRIGGPARGRAPRGGSGARALLVAAVVGTITGGGLRLARIVAERPPTAPAAVEVQRRCWDDTLVAEGERCDVTAIGAQFRAFGLTEAGCRAAPNYGHDHNTTSFICPVHGVEVHIAAFASATARVRRLARYGPSRSLGGGRVAAGGADRPSQRYLRTYDGSSALKGLLMYTSVDATRPGAVAVLNGLAQLPADVLLHGGPVAGVD